MPQQRKTLTRYSIECEHRHPGSTGDFSGLLDSLATAVKIISNQVGRGALVGALGSAGLENIQGEIQKKLDIISNEVMVEETEWTGHLAAMASEEMEDVYPIPAAERRGKYLLVFDPLDGSSNIDANITVGTIFSILRSPDPGGLPRAGHFLQPGVDQVCAGFALYGASTMLILTTGDGVDGFTLDRDIGAFILTHPQMRIPEDCSEFAINASNERFWERPVRRYIDECLAGTTGPRERDFNMRWIASLVAETYRILTRGGVFLYPRDSKEPAKEGRLRLLYECNPVAFLVEQAGGAASTGRDRVMEIKPSGLHQRIPMIFGSRNEVERIVRYHTDDLDDPGASFDDSLFNSRSLFRVLRPREGT
jgi:fructose-1,6-bisphosphatase I/sedoheptulose-1,7-bisphosphatase